MKKIVTWACIRKFFGRMTDEILHSKQADAISTGIMGAVYGTRLNSTNMGIAIANVLGTSPRYAIKQVDRLCGNIKIDWKVSQSKYVRYVIASRKTLFVSLDWTEFGKDQQSQLMLNLITSHGRATPLLWKTYYDRTIRHHRSQYERSIIRALKDIIPPGTHIILLADRGFFSIRFFDYIQRILGWDYIIRMRENTYVTTNDGRYFKIKEGVPSNGRIAEYRNAMVTAKDGFVENVVCLKRRNMKEAWALATSMKSHKQEIIDLYARRFTCEEHYRDAKDDRFGIGFKETRVSTPARRDRMTFVNAVAVILMTLLGAAGERLGCDRMLRANTVQSRTHSLYRQGREYVKGMLQSQFTRLRKLLWQLFYEHPKTYVAFGVL